MRGNDPFHVRSAAAVQGRLGIIRNLATIRWASRGFHCVGCVLQGQGAGWMGYLSISLESTYGQEECLIWRFF